MLPYDEYMPLSRVSAYKNAYKAIKELRRDCLEIWVIVDPPRESHFQTGDVVFLDDLCWTISRDGDMFFRSLDGEPIDYELVRNANWAHQVYQWDIYNHTTRERETLIDRSK